MSMNTGTHPNGVDVDRLVQTVGAIKENPDLAKFRFRASTNWMQGGHSRTTIKGFFGAGQEDTSRAEPFILEGDEPSVLLGMNAGPNAVESVLQALASCLTVGFVYNAAAQGIGVKSLEFDLEGELDLQAFLGITEGVRPGYSEIRIKYRTECDAPAEKVDQLWSHVEKTSPVLDIVRNPVPVVIERAS